MPYYTVFTHQHSEDYYLILVVGVKVQVGSKLGIIGHKDNSQLDIVIFTHTTTSSGGRVF